MPSAMTSLPRAVSTLLALLGATVALPASAQLAAHSPFLPQQGSAAAPTAGAPLEFGGYLDTPSGERLYRIKDPGRKASEWVKLNEKSPSLGVVAKQFDEANDTLTIDYQGQSLTLAKKEAKILSAGNVPQVMPQPMPVAGNTNVAPAVTQSVVVNPTQADEQRRLEAVAAEVARRRALREQATQQINQGVAPQITPQVMPQQRNFQPNAQGRNQQNQQGVQRRGGQGARQQR
jgi:hypothetical protein